MFKYCKSSSRGCIIIRNSINNNEKELNASWTDRKKEKKGGNFKFVMLLDVSCCLAHKHFPTRKRKKDAFCSSTCSRWRLHRAAAVKVKRRDPANPTSTGFLKGIQQYIRSCLEYIYVLVTYPPFQSERALNNIFKSHKKKTNEDDDQS